MSNTSNGGEAAGQSVAGRRRFLISSSAAMTGGLVAGYGTLLAMAGRYLYPSGEPTKAWLFVTELAAMEPGDAMEYQTPTGATVVVARKGSSGTVEDFIALSSTCPHLGCQVEWQPHNHRFFCPCHNGVFDPDGKAIEGPPAAAGQSLLEFPLMVKGGLLYIEVPTESVVDPWQRRRHGPDAAHRAVAQSCCPLRNRPSEEA